MSERTLRIFVSSPSDVAPERARVKLVADRLNGELGGSVRLEILRWEDGFYSAASSFQQAIDAAIGNMTATDMVLCILWKRAGLKLDPAIWHRPDGSPYESGTVLEFETAIAVSRQHKGVPDCYLFRKSADVLYHADRAQEEMDQHQLLEAIWKRWTQTTEGYNTAGYQHFSDTDDFEQKLEACLRQWLERLGVVAKGPVWDRTLKGSPFRGLAAFDAGHSTVFFGREAAIARATERLRRAPFLLVIGASGSGKSSLLRAGIIPRATAPGIVPDIDFWRPAVIVPSGDPITALAEALFADGALGPELKAGDFPLPQILAELLAVGGNAALAPIRTALARAAAARKEALHYDEARPGRLFIAVDQVERLFVEVEAPRVEAFARVLRGLVEAGLASLVVVLRSDGYGRFQGVESFLALLESRGATLNLLAPSPTELEDIVSRPVAACHPPLAYEHDAQGRSLAEILVADAKGGDALPLLQMTLQRLFDAEQRRGDGMLSFADYPGMDAAVARTAEEAVALLDERARAALPALITAFVRDVSIAPDGALESLTIVPVARQDFERGQAPRAALIDEFIARRLLTAEDASGAVYVRPVHEALLRVVPAALAIIKENAALIRIRNTLEPMVTEWSRAAAPAKPDFLATSPALIAGAAQLDERLSTDLRTEMRKFIAQSLAADTRRREAARARQRNALIATAAGLVVALGLAATAGLQWRSAQANADRALQNFHGSADQAEALIVTLGGKLRNDPGITREGLKTILMEGQRQIEALASRDPSDHYVAQVRAKAIVSVATTLYDLGDIAGAKTALSTCVRDIRSRPREYWDSMDRHVIALCYGIASKLAAAENQIDTALDLAQNALDVASENAKSEPGTGNARELAVALIDVGDLLVTKGQLDQAHQHYQQALELRRQLATNSGELLARLDLAGALDRIGRIADQRLKFDDALSAYHEALDIERSAYEQNSQNTFLKENLSVAYCKVAVVLARAGRPAEAVDYYKPCIDLRRSLVELDQSNWYWRRLLAESINRMAIVLVNSGERDEGFPLFAESIALYRTIVAHDGQNAVSRHELAIALNQFAFATLGSDKASALETLHESLGIFRELASGDSPSAAARLDVAMTLSVIAEAGEETQKNYAEAVAIFQSLDDRGLLPVGLKVSLAKIKAYLETLPKP